jgi:N-acetylneuraminic acid mutarotase
MVTLQTTALVAQWESIAPLPEGNGGFMAGCVGGKIVIAGGTNWRHEVKHWLDKVWVYDPNANEWSAGPSLPHPVAYAACACDGAHLYFAGGGDGKSARNEVYALGADLKIKEIGRLPHPIAFPGGAWANEKLYVLGGIPGIDDWTKTTSGLLVADLRLGKISTLASLAELGHGFGIPAVAAAGGKIFAFTGAWLPFSTAEVSNIAEAFSYDLAKGQWHSIRPYPKPVRGLAAVALDECRIYLAGGYGSDDEGFLSEGLIYHADTDRYTPAQPIPFSNCTTIVRCGDWIYLLGGEDKKRHRVAQGFRIRTEALGSVD